MATYDVELFRDDEFWVIRCPALDVAGQARSPETAEQDARELIALWLDKPVEQVEIQLVAR